jgi:hypothetical protein
MKNNQEKKTIFQQNHLVHQDDLDIIKEIQFCYCGGWACFYHQLADGKKTC